MRKILFLFAVLTVLLIIFIRSFSDYNSVEFCVAYTTNMEGKIEYYPKIATAINELRKDCDSLILIDNGDSMTGDSMLSFYLKDSGMITPQAYFFKKMKYDFINIAQEDFSYGRKAVSGLLKDSGAGVITTNLPKSGGLKYIDIQGVKIAVQGIVSPVNMEGLPDEVLKDTGKFTNAFAVTDKKNLVHSDADFNILAFNADLKDVFLENSMEDTDFLLYLHQNFPFLNLVLFGTTEKMFDRKVMESTKYINAGNEEGQLGFAKIRVLKKDNNKIGVITSLNTDVINYKILEDDPEVKKDIAVYEDYISKIRGENLTRIYFELNNHSVMKHETSADRVIHELHLLLAKLNGIQLDYSISHLSNDKIEIRSGHDVSIKEIEQIYPLNDFPAIVKIKGRKIKEYMEFSFGRAAKSKIYPRPSLYPLKYNFEEDNDMNTKDFSFDEEKIYTVMIGSSEIKNLRHLQESNIKIEKVLPEMTKMYLIKNFPQTLWFEFAPLWYGERGSYD